MSILVVVPTYNEYENIAILLDHIVALPIAVDVLVVDDASPDGTSVLVQKYTKQHNSIHLYTRQQKSGIGSAYCFAFSYAIQKDYAYVITMDGDGSHSPLVIPALVQKAKEGCDLVIGSRRIPGGSIKGWGMRRKLMSRGAMEISRIALGLVAKDVTSGFRCYDTTLLSRLPLGTITSNGYAFQEEMLYMIQQAGGSIQEIPITFVDRRFGKSKLSWREIVHFFVMIVRLKIKAIQKK